VPALIGMLMLVGIVVTNAIVLIDLVNQFRRDGRGLREAVLEGAAQRLRPILMTAVATIFALLPMSLGLTGGGVFISQPLAIVVIGGLISSTLLTLVLVPVLYTLVERLRARLGRRDPEAPLAAEDESDNLAPSAAGTPIDATTAGWIAPAAGAVGVGVAGNGHDRTPRHAAAHERATEPQPQAAPGWGGAAQPASSEPAPGRVAPSRLAPGQAPAELPPARPGLVGSVLGGTGQPVPGASVVVFDGAGNQVASTVSGPDGRYRITVPGPGEHLVVGYGEAGNPVAERVRIGGLPQRHDIRPARTAQQGGTVDGVVHAGPHPAPDIVTTLLDGRGTVVGTARTGQDGTFRFTGIAPGDYTVTAHAEQPGVRSVRVGEHRPVSVELSVGVPQPGRR
jgi:HAE1 family hydrophobic/amphiphilic exporter-1